MVPPLFYFYFIFCSLFFVSKSSHSTLTLSVKVNALLLPTFPGTRLYGDSRGSHPS